MTMRQTGLPRRDRDFHKRYGRVLAVELLLDLLFPDLADRLAIVLAMRDGHPTYPSRKRGDRNQQCAKHDNTSGLRPREPKTCRRARCIKDAPAARFVTGRPIFFSLMALSPRD